MKRRLSKTLLAVLVALCVMTAAPVRARAETTESYVTVEPREILTGKYTTRVTYGANKAQVVITYNYRYEASNASGKMITGVQSASVSPVSGWYSIGSSYAHSTEVRYEQNGQIAYVPITYYGGIGAGNNIEVNQTVVINLLS